MHVRKEGPRKYYYSSGKLLLISLTAVIRMALALRYSEAEVVQLCKPQPINSLAVLLGKRGRRVYCDCDDHEATSNRFSAKWQRSIVRYFEDSIVDYSSGITVNTFFNRDRYRLLGYPMERMVYVPNGVERSRFCNPRKIAAVREQLNVRPEEQLIVYIGSLGLLNHPVDLLLDAFKLVAKEIADVRLMLIGGGEDYDRIIQLAHSLGIAERTIFLGRVTPEEVPSLLELATVSVDPVKDDLVARARSPLKIMESLTMGIPVVTGDVGDRRDILMDGVLGVLVKPGSSQALADGLLKLLQDQHTLIQMRKNALHHRERWYWDNLIREFIKIYQNV